MRIVDHGGLGLSDVSPTAGERVLSVSVNEKSFKCMIVSWCCVKRGSLCICVCCGADGAKAISEAQVGGGWHNLGRGYIHLKASGKRLRF